MMKRRANEHGVLDGFLVRLGGGRLSRLARNVCMDEASSGLAMIRSEHGFLTGASPAGFLSMRSELALALLDRPVIHPTHWQKLNVAQSPAHATHELLNVTLWYEMPQTKRNAQLLIKPDLPWAEAHFQERVGGLPINPGVEHANWPYHANGADLHLRDGKYDHNYMERMWAGKLTYDSPGICPFIGYRFDVGDLDDVLKQLNREPSTRQAYLPIWFPEDTGATNGQRVPCSIGYHFIIRDDRLHVQYTLRSCEIYRHFTNDIYMAVRLGQWVVDQLDHGLALGQLTVNIVSLHGFVGDVEKIQEMIIYA